MSQRNGKTKTYISGRETMHPYLRDDFEFPKPTGSEYPKLIKNGKTVRV